MNTKERVYLTLFTVSVIVYFPFAHWISTTPVGTELFLLGVIYYGFAGLAAVVAIPGSLVALCFQKTRRDALLVLVLSLVYLPLAFSGIAMGMHVRMARMTDFAERSQPLIDAINQYSDDHGGPPETLEQLVPDYLPAVPGTGMMAYSEYKYYAGAEARERYQENPWVLVVDTSWGMNFDQMLYFPKQNYPKQGYGGNLERLGEWAYNHE
ncbi:hypothetical protein Pan241w_22690 [Gimesia alba]|uniref:Uncharacterized protein n=1 Tax=Gimesia alba TaxID=2527973 RepID=A0A517RE82_9PLAN|nr:hypothetical protein [Gimesia alba]QDT42188.1 hypothetical protein Pan241w_22690 [Gimesia alba]